MKLLKPAYCLMAWLLAFSLQACSEDGKKTVSPGPIEIQSEDFDLGGFSVDSLNQESSRIYVSPENKKADSLVFQSVDGILNATGGRYIYIASSEDASDPDVVDWDHPIEKGTSIATGENAEIPIVILDDQYRVVDIWTIVLPVEKTSSSSRASSSASSSTSTESAQSSDQSAASGTSEAESSSSENVSGSSDSGKSSDSGESSESGESSSSEGDDESSSSVVSSSSEEGQESSSSVELSSEKDIVTFQIWVAGSRFSSAVLNATYKTISVDLDDASLLEFVQMYRLTLSDGASSDIPLRQNLVFQSVGAYNYEYAFAITAEDGTSDEWKILVSIPKGVALSKFGVATEDSSITITGNKIYVEVPYGTDLANISVLPMDTVANLVRPVEMQFVDNTGELQTYTVVAGTQLPGMEFDSRRDEFWATVSDALEKSATVADINISSSKNLDVSDSKMTLTSVILVGKEALTGIKGSEKLVGGFYYTGVYNGASALDVYDVDNSGRTPSTGNSDISKDMGFGRPFVGRPASFSIDYSYTHVGNSNSSYPQKSLIYVILLSADSTIVAAGVKTDAASVNNASVTVPLVYGSDEGLLSSGYLLCPGLKAADATKEVAIIQVVFASSAYAHIVAGGTTWLNDPTKDFRGGKGSKLILDSFRLNY